MQTELLPKISLGNAKLQDTFLWSIPPVSTCPGATDQCKKDCYALKAYRRFPTAKKSYDHNYELTKQDNFADLIVHYLFTEKQSKRKTARYEYFRVHESGDFYNQNYLNKFIEIAKRAPHIKFLAYTKSGWLDFSKLPTNFVVRLSLWDDSNTKKIAQALDVFPRAIMDGMQERAGTFYCAPTLQCHKDCGRYCWEQKTDVKFSLT